MTRNQIDFAKFKEEQRHNRASESIGATTAGAAVSQAAASHRMASESQRHNIATEGINWYTAENLGILQKAQAVNQLATGAKNLSEVGVQAGMLDETVRHDYVTEDIGQQQADTAAKNADTARIEAITGGVKDITGAIKDVAGSVGAVAGLFAK